MIDATEWLVCAFASQERAKVCASGNPALHCRLTIVTPNVIMLP